MTREQHDEAANRIRLALNQYWTKHCDELIRQAVEIDADPGFISDAMLTVAIGKVLASHGFRDTAAMLAPIAANFEKIAEEVDAAVASAGVSPEKLRVRH